MKEGGDGADGGSTASGNEEIEHFGEDGEHERHISPGKQEDANHAKRRASLKKLSSKHESFLPDVSEVISRLRSGAEGFSQAELDRMATTFMRFKDPDSPELHKDELVNVLKHLGYQQLDKVKILEMADSISSYPTLEKADFMAFMEKHAEFETNAYKQLFEQFDEDNSGFLDSEEIVTFLSSLGFTPLRSMVKEAMDLVDLDGNGQLDFEETVIMLHVYKHSEGFTLDEISELTAAYKTAQDALDDSSAIHHKNAQTLPADKLADMLVRFFGPAAAEASVEIQTDVQTRAAGKGGDTGVPLGLNFQEAVVWARKLRDKEFHDFRDAFDKFDEDKSNSIDRNELAKIIASLGFTIPQKTIDEMIEEANSRGDIPDEKLKDGGVELDYDAFVHLMKILQENDGFSEEEIAEIQDTFEKFDEDGSGDIDVIELSDMLRHLGHMAIIEEVRRIHSKVDFNGNGALDFREFVRFMRLHREEEIHHIRDAFEEHADEDADPPVIKAANIEEAIKDLIKPPEGRTAPLPDVPGLDPKTYVSGNDLGFDQFVEIADTIRELIVEDGRKNAGYSEGEVERYKQVFEGFDKKKQENLKVGEATDLLMSMGFELRSQEEQRMLKEQIRKAGQDAIEAGAKGVVEGMVNFWVFLQLIRTLNRREDEEAERKLLKASDEAKFTTQEVSDFQEVFDNCWDREQSAAEPGMQQVGRKTISRTTMYKLLRSMEVRLEGAQRLQLEEKIQQLSGGGSSVDFPGFLRLMRWMMDTDFGKLNETAAKAAAKN